MTKQDFINLLRVTNVCVALILLIGLTFFIAYESEMSIKNWVQKHDKLISAYVFCHCFSAILPKK